MTSAETATLKYWQARFPRQFAQAARVAGVTGFGQTDTTGTSTFDSVMGSLTGLLTSYGQYKVASQIADSQTAAKSGVLTLPGSATTGTTNWILYGGIALVGLVALAVFMKKRR